MSQSGITGSGGGPTPGGDPTILPYKRVNTAMSPYTVLSTDCFISCDTTGGVLTVYLPGVGTTVGKIYYIKDAVGKAAIANVVIDGAHDGVKIDDFSTAWLNAPYECIGVIFNGTNYEAF